MNYWMVVYNEKTDDFYRDSFAVENNGSTDKEIIKEYERKNTGYKVIQLGLGDLPPKTYRTLQYLKKEFD